MADDTSTSPQPASAGSAWTAVKAFVSRLSLSKVQAIVGTLAGLASVGGALFSVAQVAHPSNTGELVAVVQESGSHRTVTDATIEVLTAGNAIVATLMPDANGRAAQKLKEGFYVVRVSHPRFAAEERRIQIQPRQTVEIKANLRRGSSSPVERAVNNGVRGVRRALRF